MGEEKGEILLNQKTTENFSVVFLHFKDGTFFCAMHLLVLLPYQQC